MNNKRAEGNFEEGDILVCLRCGRSHFVIKGRIQRRDAGWLAKRIEENMSSKAGSRYKCKCGSNLPPSYDRYLTYKEYGPLAKALWSIG